MNEQVRNFEFKPAVRASVPLLMGLYGPSGSGKTFSALRLATGIQRVAGGDIIGIDTEARRMLHYADRFKFRHVQFDAPFGSRDYLAAIKAAVKAGAGVVIIDSFSHEHDGPGGLLDTHERELDRLAGDDYAKRERVKMLAWQRPKAARRDLINGILQIPANFIFCFRAKEKIKIVKKNGKNEPEPQGFMPIAGEELVFEMTMTVLLLPHADGVPTWRSDEVGEKLMMKLPEQFKGIFRESKPLDEDLGVKLATWARGDAIPDEADDEIRSDAIADELPYERYCLGEIERTDLTAAQLTEWWNSTLQKRQRKELPEAKRDELKRLVMKRIAELKATPAEAAT